MFGYFFLLVVSCRVVLFVLGNIPSIRGFEQLVFFGSVVLGSFSALCCNRGLSCLKLGPSSWLYVEKWKHEKKTTSGSCMNLRRHSISQ